MLAGMGYNTIITFLETMKSIGQKLILIFLFAERLKASKSLKVKCCYSYLDVTT